jgi:S1-C subfamily serine protease
MKKTLYQILDVAPGASPEEIAAAYQQAVGKFDLDVAHDPNERVLLREAFQILSNPQKRSFYDSSLKNKASNEGHVVVAEYEGAQTNWKNWIIGALLFAAVAGWWMASKSLHATPTPVAPMMTVRPVNVVTSQNVAHLNQVNGDVAAATPRAVLSTEALYALLAPSVARVNVMDGQNRLLATGSGVVIGDGEVITNCHVTRSGPQLELQFSEKIYSASVIVADEQFDLCRMRVSGLSANKVDIGNLADVHVGQKVYAIGAPQGLDLTISEGIVSSLRDIPGKGIVIQTTAAISPGSSGGGLFDSSGRLIGITTFQSRTGQNLNFALPAEWISKMTDRRESTSNDE